MPPAASALAAAPASICLRVSRTLRGGRSDGHQVAQHAIEVLPHLAVPERRSDVLADGVQRSAVTPGVEHVPLIGVLVDVVDGCGPAAKAHGAGRVAEARDQLSFLRVRVHTLGYTSTSRIAAKVHMLLAARCPRPGLLPHPAEQVAAVAADLVDVVPAAADHAVERIRQP